MPRIYPRKQLSSPLLLALSYRSGPFRTYTHSYGCRMSTPRFYDALSLHVVFCPLPITFYVSMRYLLYYTSRTHCICPVLQFPSSPREHITASIVITSLRSPLISVFSFCFRSSFLSHLDSYCCPKAQSMTLMSQDELCAPCLRVLCPTRTGHNETARTEQATC